MECLVSYNIYLGWSGVGWNLCIIGNFDHGTIFKVLLLLIFLSRLHYLIASSICIFYAIITIRFIFDIEGKLSQMSQKLIKLIIQGMSSANQIRLSIVVSHLNGYSHTQNDP